MRRALPTPFRRRAFTALSLAATCTVLGLTAAPAHAAPAHAAPAHSPAAASPATAPNAPTPNAPVSGHRVSGAVYGAAARRAAGSAAASFRRLNHQRVLASQAPASQAPAGRPAAPTRPAASQLHAWWGSFPGTNSGTAVMATQSVSSTLRLSHSGDVLYAPTMTPADNSCIEVVTMHNKTQAQVWAWDWCQAIAPGAEVTVNSSFLAKYTATVGGLTSYTTEDVQTNASTNTWTAYLYDYQTKAWDTLFTQSGTDQSGLSYGWDMFEFYSSTNPSTGNTYVCGDLQSSGTKIESSSIQIYSGGTWTPASPSNSAWSPEADPSPSSYKCPDMQFSIITNNSAWSVDVT